MDLRTALKQAGLQPESSLREEKEEEARIFLDAEAQNLAVGKRDRMRTKLIDELNETSSVQKFRVLAKKLLLTDPRLIRDVINIAHARGIREKKKEGGSALIAQLLQTRSLLDASGLSDQEMSNIVNRTIPKH